MLSEAGLSVLERVGVRRQHNPTVATAASLEQRDFPRYRRPLDAMTLAGAASVVDVLITTRIASD